MAGVYNYLFDITHVLRPYSGITPANPEFSPPPNATRIVPELKVGFWPCWNGEKWNLCIDNRGKIAYNTRNHQTIDIIEIGKLPPELTFAIPNTPFDKWNGTQWVTDIGAQYQHEVRQAEFHKQKLLIDIFYRITPLQDAIELGIATDEEKAALIEWRKYRVLLNRIDCSIVPDIVWPEQPKE
ncbi:tail fiber assembly protein [Xenorhabdus bovienii]|uniref:Tail fiber assembly protein n=1 Tax=Xenorhabdus bovienii str. feltiae Moldova TaxID=1398200 RepID=A0A077NP04_XENBV|nr:tail fiber assembly protein [Xenorhabdus bovienii]CDH00630.1 conserved hypothetical protein [Xenorhabdus bovienii str. feltiae Moldova]